MQAQSRLDSSRGMITLDLYTVGRYYPEKETCDLYPASIQQRGELTDVPVMVGFGGSWEAQTSHVPDVAGFVSEEWGNVSRGARWGARYPVEAGDTAIVAYIGGGASDPVIIGFLFHRGNFGVAWAANQILSAENDYTSQLADDEDLMSGRYDLLLPSGGWFRCGQKSSWTIATAPTDRPKAFFTMHSTGIIRMKARAGEEYAIHAEFDPEQEYARLVVGELETGALLEFKDGNITLKAPKRLILQAEQIEGDVRPQIGGQSAMDVLTSSPSAAISDQELPGLVSQAAGQMALQAAAIASPVTNGVVVTTTVPTDNAVAKVIDQELPAQAILSNLLSNPAIDGATRGRIGDILQDPSALVDSAVSALSENMPNDLAIGDRLTSLLGAQVLNGDLSSFTSRLNLDSLSMLKELGVPSWDLGELQGAISSGTFEGLPRLFSGNLGNRELIDTALRFVGDRIMEGATPTDARALLQEVLDLGGVQDRFNALLPSLNSTALRTPEGTTETIAQRLGRHVMRGNNGLGGGINLFSGLDSLLEGNGQLGAIQRVAGQIEEFAGNPHKLVEQALGNSELSELANLPTEIRDVVSRIPQDLIGRLPQLATGALGDLRAPIFNADEPPPDGTCEIYEEAPEELSSILPAWQDDEREAGAVIQSAPQGIRAAIANLSEEVLSGLQGASANDFAGMLQNPRSLLDGVDTSMIESAFGGLTSLSTGTFDMRVMTRAVFQTLPLPGAIARDLGGREFHVDTEALPIERVVEYGELDLPGWWND